MCTRNLYFEQKIRKISIFLAEKKKNQFSVYFVMMMIFSELVHLMQGG